MFIVTLVLPSIICERMTIKNEDTASISGFITDFEMEPITGAKISLSCGEESFECYSDGNGYYYKEWLETVCSGDLWQRSRSIFGYYYGNFKCANPVVFYRYYKQACGDFYPAENAQVPVTVEKITMPEQWF